MHDDEFAVSRKWSIGILSESGVSVMFAVPQQTGIFRECPFSLCHASGHVTV